MPNDYNAVKGGKIKLKGNKTLFKADKPKKKKTDGKKEINPDEADHGGWWRIDEEGDLKGGVDLVIESGSSSKTYIAALDNGKFTVGAKHFAYGEQPSPEEVLTLIKTPDDSKMSLKTGFGKYVGVDPQGQLVAVSDAIGTRERFEAIFQDGKCAIQSVSSGLFLNFSVDDLGYVNVSSKVVGENEVVNIRTNAEKQGPIDFSIPEDKKGAAECETTYQKMYQHSKVDLKNRLISYDVKDKSAVRQAQNVGNLHETLLDRRMKLKSDKYC
jgi:protein FRG1